MSIADPFCSLIYDVGVENGDDSAQYLELGYRVVGVEASPLAVQTIGARFKAEIAQGRYILVPVGIAESDGVTPFWVCDDHPPWSSFDRDIASRNGSRHHQVEVQTRSFGSIIKEFGVPHYCKIDIEGNDNLCLREFTPEKRPAYVSVELIRRDDQLSLLRDHGFTRFKIISQRTFRQPTLQSLRRRSLIGSAARRAVTFAEARIIPHRGSRKNRYARGSSGPFGEDSHGRWLGFDEARALSEAVQHLDDRMDWHDIHAK